MGHSSRYVDTGQEDKDKGLDSGGKDGNCHERKGKEEGDDRGDDQDEQFFSKDIPEKTDGQRDRTGEMADYLYRKKKRREKRGGASKMFEIFEYTLGSDPLPVIIDKDRKSAAHGHVEFAGGGHKSRDKTQQITEKDKEPDRAYHRKVFLPLLTDDVTQEVFEEFDDELEETLSFGGDDLEFACSQTQ